MIYALLISVFHSHILCSPFFKYLNIVKLTKPWRANEGTLNLPKMLLGLKAQWLARYACVEESHISNSPMLTRICNHHQTSKGNFLIVEKALERWQRSSSSHLFSRISVLHVADDHKENIKDFGKLISHGRNL